MPVITSLFGNDEEEQEPIGKAKPYVDEVRKRYPQQVGTWTDAEILKNLQDPAKFRQAFPEHSNLKDEEIKTAVNPYGAGPGMLEPKYGDSALTRGAKGVGRSIGGLLHMPVDLAEATVPKSKTDLAMEGMGLHGPMVAKHLFIDPGANILEHEHEKEIADAAHGTDTASPFNKFAAHLPLVGPMAAGLHDRAETEDQAGTLAEGATDIGQMLAGPKIAEGAGKVVKGTFGGKLPFEGRYANDRVTPGGPTRGEVYSTVRDLGGDMNLAQASESEGLRAREAGLESGLGSSGRMSRANQRSAGKFQDIVEQTKDQIHPDADVVEQGARMQKVAQTAKEVAHENASTAYDNLDELFNGEAVSTQGVKQAWRQLKNEMKGPNALMPSTAPGQLLKIGEEIEGLPANTKFGTMHRLRSRLNNAMFTEDLAPGESQRGASILSDSMNTTMRNSAGKAGKGALKAFDEAQAGWKDYLDTFGDRSSPLARILPGRKGALPPERIVDEILSNRGKGSVQAIQQITKHAKDFIPLLQREFIRRLHDAAGNRESMDYGKMEHRQLGYSDPFMEALFPDPELRTKVRNLAAAGKSLSFDFNPSGSGKTSIANTDLLSAIGGATEVGRGVFGHDPVAIGTGAAIAAGPPLVRNIGARILNSQRLTDHLMGYKPGQGIKGAAARVGIEPSVSGPKLLGPAGSLLDDLAAAGQRRKSPEKNDVVPGNTDTDVTELKKKYGITDKPKLDQVGAKPGSTLDNYHSKIRQRLRSFGLGEDEIPADPKGLEDMYDGLLADNEEFASHVNQLDDIGGPKDLAADVEKSQKKRGGSKITPADEGIAGAKLDDAAYKKLKTLSRDEKEQLWQRITSNPDDIALGGEVQRALKSKRDPFDTVDDLMNKDIPSKVTDNDLADFHDLTKSFTDHELTEEIFDRLTDEHKRELVRRK